MADEDEDGEETEDEDGNDQEKEGANKGAKKFFSLIVLAIFLLFLIGGSTAAYFSGLLDPMIDWVSGTEGEEKEESSISNKQPEDKIKIIIKMDPLAIPVFQGNSVAATVQINIKLETDDENKAERINKILPIIADAFISDLHGFMPRLLKKKKEIDYIIIKQRLQLIANKVAGTGTISNIIAESINDQSE
jgi:flagellar FliL protein